MAALIWNVQLVFDCRDPDAVMLFWGPALRYNNDLVRASPEELREWRKDFPQYDGRGRIDDSDARRIPVYIQQVPEAKTGRNRVRLEVADDPSAVDDTLDELYALGASDEGGELRDVEGNEFTVVGDADGRSRRLRSVVLDSLDPDRMVAFWSEVLGYQAGDGRCDPVPGLARIEDGSLVVHGQRVPDELANWALGHREPSSFPSGVVLDLMPGLAFERTDEPKRSKNRLHLDVRSLDVEADLARLLKLGATVQRWDDEHVLADPEGNEFCLG